MTLSDKEIKVRRKYIKKYYSQKPSKYDRIRSYKDSTEKNKESSELGSNYEMRDEFTRDKDRIIHTKAFRRLQNKAQVYSHEKSDYYRTRLTHTLEVSQIARGIARNLNVNEDLTEAIALGHDIGHTPFGHIGEEVLDKIMRGEDDLGGNITYKIDYGGFKHNFNSLKILELVEHEDENRNGLKLTWQVLDGIVKHTSIKKEDKCWNWKRFVDKEEFFEEILNYDYNNQKINNTPFYENPLTIEGQIVRISDEIAQRTHDLDDSSKNNGNMFYYLKLIIEETSNSISKDMKGYETFEDLKEKLNLENILNDYSEEDLYMENDLRWDYCIKCMVSFFIRDVTENSMINIYDSEFNEVSKIKQLKKDYKRKYIYKNLITFSEVGKIFNRMIENFIENKIINSYEVNRFDGKGKFILRQLFKAYYENPKQMPQKQLKILDNMLDKNSEKYYKLKIGSKDVNEIKFNNPTLKDIKYSEINDLIKSLKLNDNKFKKLISKYPKDDLETKLNNIANDDSETDKLKHYLENHYAYLYVISNYISKMTDNYAEKEYKKLYLSN